jgi:hypothetical protein
MAGFRSTTWVEDDELRSGGRRRFSYRTGGQDPFWNQTELLLPLDTDFRDYSRNKRDTFTGGGVSISSAQSKWGKASAYFNGTTDGVYARDVGIGTGDFTVEMFFKSASSVQYAQLIGNENPGFTLLANNDSGSGGQVACYAPSGLIVSSSAGDFTDDAWHHVALGRSGTSVSLWLDGTRLGTATSSDSFSGQDLWVGRNNSITPRNLVGYIQDVRITKAARYSGSSITVPGKLPCGDLVRT